MKDKDMSTEQERVSHTPGPWKYKNVQGAGLMIYGPVPFKANCVEFTLKAADQPLFSLAPMDSGLACRSHPEGYPMLAYETWIQFAPKEWDEMQEANARLIAAAPELLVALESCREHLTCHVTENDTRFDCECCGCEMDRIARAAIAKATNP